MESNNRIQKQRVPYVDMAKGILILMVMIGHMQNVCKELSVHDEVFATIDHLEWFWGPFFMPAFFVITGFCSNFNKPFKSFLISNVKGILIPAFTLGILARWIGLLNVPDVSLHSLFSLGVKNFIINGGSFWFLAALFLSKLTFYVISKFLSNLKVVGIIVIILHIVGFYMFENSICRNYWYFQHSMMLTIYLYVGQRIKESKILFDSKKLTLSLWGGYLITVSIILILGYESPHIAHNVTITNITFIPHFMFSIWGAILILVTAKQFKTIKVICYLGKNSLIYYCLHINLLFLIVTLYGGMLGRSLLFSIFCWLTTIVSVVLLCTIASYVLNTKYINYILGKF